MTNEKVSADLFDIVRTWHSTEDGIAIVVEDYYKNLFTSANLNRENMDRVLNSVDKLVTLAMNHHLLQVLYNGWNKIGSIPNAPIKISKA